MSFFKKDKEGNASFPEDAPSQLKKIMEHLTFLEKKLDTLLEQSQNRSRFGGGSHFSRPRGNFRGGGNREGFNSSRPAGQGQQQGTGGPAGPGGPGRPGRPGRPDRPGGRPGGNRPSGPRGYHQGGPRRHSQDPNEPKKFSNY